MNVIGKRKNVRLAMVLCVSAGTASSAFGQACGFDPKCVEVTTYLDHSYTITASACTGLIAVWAANADLTIQYFYGDQGECGPNTPSHQMYYQAGTDNKSSGPSGCVASANPSTTTNGGWSQIDANWQCTSGTTEVYTGSKFCATTYSFLNTDYMDEIALGMGSAGGEFQKVFTVSGPVTWSSTVAGSVAVAFDTGFTASGTSASRVAIFVRESVQGSGSPIIRQGLYVFPSDDDEPIALGFFADLNIDPEPTSNGYTIELDSEFDPSVTHSGTVTYDFVYDVIGGFDGNMNPNADGNNQIVCYTDRAILYGLLGTSLSDPTYNPRGDLDQDGDIDTADLTIFNTLPCNANWDCSTASPRLNSADFSAFLNSYNSSDPVCDLNGNSMLDVGDYTAFLNAYAAGCP